MSNLKLGTLVRIENIKDSKEKFLQIKKMGFESCQLVYKPEKYLAEDAKIIKKAADVSGIDISAQFCGYYDNDTVWDNYHGFLTAGLGIEAYRKSRLDYVKQAAGFAKEAGISDIVIHAGFIPNNPFSSDYFPLLSAVTQLCEYCKKYDMNVLLETGGESAVALLRLIQDTKADNLYVNLDPANMLMYGYANPVDALYTIGKYVRNIHGKDGMPPTDSRVLGQEKDIGEGCVDFYSVLKKLKELGYNRYITIEREIAEGQQDEKMLKAKEFFEKILTDLDYEK